MDVPTQLELCLYDQLDSYSLLLVSLLFNVIPTPFLNFTIFIYFVIKPKPYWFKFVLYGPEVLLVLQIQSDNLYISWYFDQAPLTIS